MNKTYDDILVEMKNAYFKESKEKPDDNSSVMQRLKAVASELFALSCYGDYIFKQAFIQTAAGKQLDYHGAVRGCVRKTASPSMGMLTFYISEPLQEDIVIPSKTVCSSGEKNYIQFATLNEAVIKAGAISVSVPSQSLGNSQEYNVLEGDITVLVNAPAGISGVINADAFTGGCDEESDASFRKRIMQHYAFPANGVNAASVSNIIKNLDFVTDCFVTTGEVPGEILVVVKTKSNHLTDEQNEKIKKSVGISELVGAAVSIIAADSQDFSISIEVKVTSGYNKTEIEQQVHSLVREECSSLKIGESLSLNTISKQIIKLDGISTFNVYSKNALGEVVVCGSTSCLHLSELAVNCFDE